MGVPGYYSSGGVTPYYMNQGSGTLQNGGAGLHTQLYDQAYVQHQLPIIINEQFIGLVNQSNAVVAQ